MPAALAETADVSTDAETDVAAVDSDQLGDPKTGLHRQQQQRAVAAAFPPATVGRIDEGVDLDRGEKRHQLLVEPFGGDGEHPLDELGVFGVPQGRVGEQRPDRGQPQVAGSRPIVPVGFEMLQEGADHLHVEVGPVQRSRRFPGALLDEHKQQLQRIPVGSDRAWADPTLLDQPLAEEALQGGGDRAHRVVTSREGSRRCAASASSSGAADRYQYVERGSRCPSGSFRPLLNVDLVSPGGGGFSG